MLTVVWALRCSGGGGRLGRGDEGLCCCGCKVLLSGAGVLNHTERRLFAKKTYDRHQCIETKSLLEDTKAANEDEVIFVVMNI